MVQIQLVIKQKMVRTLINGATIKTKGQENFVSQFQLEAKDKLRLMLGSVLREKYSINLKVMAIWAAVWPKSYQWVHSVYAKLSGSGKKYEVS